MDDPQPPGLAYGIAPPAIVRITRDPEPPTQNTIGFNLANTSGSQMTFVNPDELTRASRLPAYADATLNPLSRVYVWFPWGDDPGDLAPAGDAPSIVASSVAADWAASDAMTDPELGTYWILFPLSKSVVLGVNESVEFEFSGIVSYLPAGQANAMTWVWAEPRLGGYATTKETVSFYKEAVAASLSASPSSAIPGEQVTLAWQTTNISSCSLDPGGFTGLQPSGSVQVRMPETARADYKLTAYPDAGSPVYADASVTAASGWVDLGQFVGYPVSSVFPGSIVRSLTGGVLCVAYSEDPHPFTSWASRDGVSWTEASPCPVRLSRALWTIVPNLPEPGPVPSCADDGETAWIIGTLTGKDESPSAVCATTDGSKWTVVNPQPPWGTLSGASAAVFQDSLWVLGGYVELPQDDGWQLTHAVWCSSDGGSTWAQTTNPPWTPRWWPTGVAAAFADRLWIFGGWTIDSPPQAIRDAWYTRDGRTWSQAAAVPWSGHAVAVALAPGADALFVLTADPVGNAAMWQMDGEQVWSAAPAPPFGFSDRPLYYAGFGPGCAPLGTGVIAVGPHTWRYMPPLDDKVRS
jgi:hypothetical protein